MEEVGRSPTYSCYKTIEDVQGINDGLYQCQKDESEGRLVVFEGVKEAQRVFAKMSNDHSLIGSETNPLLTSAMYFEDVQKWIYLGTSMPSF